jgi:hypothetical protein
MAQNRHMNGKARHTTWDIHDCASQKESAGRAGCSFISQRELCNERAKFTHTRDLDVLPDIFRALPGRCFIFCRRYDAISISHP